MRKIILSITLAAMTALSVWSAPALPGLTQVVQADGTTLYIQQQGDEHHNWLETSDGILLVGRGRSYYVADIADDGSLSPSSLLAHESALRSQAEQAAVARQARRLYLFQNYTLRKAEAHRRAAQVNGTSYLPHEGSPRILVILTAYKDQGFTVNDPLQAFDQYLNGKEQKDMGNENQRNVASVRTYFETCSKGKFSPQFDVVGPVTLPDSMAYYGYGGGNTSAERLGQMAKDALTLVKDQVDMRRYDNNGDGRAELVYLIYSGVGENQNGPAENLWAKVSPQNTNLGDSMRLSYVGCCSELFHLQRPGWINGIGVFCHEFSHAMGLPDIYPTQEAGRKVNNQSMEHWDVMDNGIYNNNGFAPQPYTAWEMEAMGWQAIETLQDDAQHVSMLPIIEEGGKAYKIPNDKNEREFIVVENIQQRGLAAGARGHGLLAYHVAYPYNTVNMGDAPNNTVGKPAVAVIPADSLLMSGYLVSDGVYTSAQLKASLTGDPFPGTSGNTRLNDDQRLPNFKFYNTSDTRVHSSLLNITEDASTGIVSFDYQHGDVTDGIMTIDRYAHAGIDRYYNLAGQRVDSHIAPRKTIRIIKGRKVVL